MATEATAMGETIEAMATGAGGDGRGG